MILLKTAKLFFFFAIVVYFIMTFFAIDDNMKGVQTMFLIEGILLVISSILFGVHFLRDLIQERRRLAANRMVVIRVNDPNKDARIYDRSVVITTRDGSLDTLEMAIESYLSNCNTSCSHDMSIAEKLAVIFRLADEEKISRDPVAVIGEVLDQAGGGALRRVQWP